MPCTSIRLPALAAAVAACTLALPAAAQDEKVRVEVGVLTCEMTDKTNLVIVSETEFACTFKHADGRSAEKFEGTVDKIGLDLTIKGSETLVWGVLAPSVDAEVSAMEGTYAGVGADVAVVAGAGANLLVGGLDKSFALQPLSVSGSKGVGASLAVQSMKLDYQGLAE